MSRMRGGAWAMGVLAAAGVFGQTQVDLQSQSKNVDFSSAVETRPAKTGTALPATCRTGDQFFNSSAAPGANLYGCTATNIWTLQSGSGGGGDTNCIASSSGAALQVSTPCVVWRGTVSYTLSGAATFTPTSGSGTIFFYLSASGVFTAGTNTTGSCNANCTVAGGVSAYPVDAAPLAHATVTGGVLGAITDDRSSERASSIEAGPGILLGYVGGVPTISSQLPLSGTTGSLGGGSLSAGTCASTSVTIAGAGTGMVAQATPNAYPGDAFLWKAYISAANTAQVEVCAIASGTPLASTYNVRVIQ